MTKDERRKEFMRWFNAIPGRNIDRIRKVCAITMYQENTVRTFLIDPERPSGDRAIPESRLRLLCRDLEREGIKPAQ